MKRRAMRRRNAKLRLGIIAALLLVIIFMIIYLLIRFSPGKEKADLNGYFNIKSEEDVGLVCQSTKSDTVAKNFDGHVYIEYEFLKKNINEIFYFDYNENQLIYTLPNSLVTAGVGSLDYYISKNKNTFDHVIVKTEGRTAYVSLDFVQQYTNLEYTYMEDPRRVLITSKWGEVTVAEIGKTDSVRSLAGIKSPILTEAVQGDVVWVLGTEDNWTKVRTGNGFIGYIQSGSLKNTRKENIEREFDQPEYKSIHKSETINLTWYQVLNYAANDYFLSDLASTKGLTVVAPTWFTLQDEEGNISSFAETSCVNYAHQLGLEVWATINDVDGDANINNILNYSSKRQNLVNQLVSAAIQYNIDGINVDLELVNADSADGFIQFIRELSVKCHNNDIVLSVDNYPPSVYSLHYNRSQQAVFADYIVIMAYDEHNANSPEAGSVASIGYVADAVSNTLLEAPAEKIILGIPFYTRVWEEYSNGDKTELECESVSMNEAKNRCRVNGATPVWDEACGQYYAEYENAGSRYRIWLEEESSIEKKLQLMKENNLAGVGSWKLGLETEGIWDLILKYVN